MHVGIAKHDLPRRMRVAAKHVELDNVKLRELFQAQAGQIVGRFATAPHHLDARKLGFSGILRYQQ